MEAVPIKGSSGSGSSSNPNSSVTVERTHMASGISSSRVQEVQQSTTCSGRRTPLELGAQKDLGNSAISAETRFSFSDVKLPKAPTLSAANVSSPVPLWSALTAGDRTYTGPSWPTVSEAALSSPGPSWSARVVTDLTSPGPSWTWKYFRVPPGLAASKATTVICQLCGAGVKRGHPGRTAMGTTALASHLSRRHKLTKASRYTTTTDPSFTAAASSMTAASIATTAGNRANAVAATTTSGGSRYTTPDPTNATYRTNFKPRLRPLKASMLWRRPKNSKITPPVDHQPFLTLFVHSCQYCGDVLSCGETMVTRLVMVAQEHAQKYHPKEYEVMLEHEQEAHRQRGTIMVE